MGHISAFGQQLSAILRISCGSPFCCWAALGCTIIVSMLVPPQLAAKIWACVVGLKSHVGDSTFALGIQCLLGTSERRCECLWRFEAW